MKKILQISCLLLFVISGYSQSQRLVFIEEFTQASCPPCETTTPALNQIIATNVEKIVQLRYQVSWPGYDPMYFDNETEVDARVLYYNVGGVPAVFADGEETANFGVLPQSTINTRYGTESPLKVEVVHTLSNDFTTSDVTVKITNEGTTEYSLSTNRLRVVFIEEDITFPKPPGSTSLKVFEAVMKKFITGTDGLELPVIAPGQTWEQTWAGETLPEVIYDYSKLAVVAFIQNDADKTIVNSGLSEAIDIVNFSDVAIQNKSVATGGYCEYSFTPKVSVTNTGNVDIAEYTVSMLINSSVFASKIITDPIETGEVVNLTMDVVNLPPGNSNISFLVSPNGSKDLAILNNFTENLVVGKIGEVTENYSNDFESVELGDVPGNTIVNRPIELRNFIVLTSEGIGGTEPIGGKGESDKSLGINFWNWDPSTVAADGFMIIADQYVPNAASKISFDWAYTSWGGSNDRMKVQVSEDCGKTFKDLFNKAGVALRTAPELNLDNAFFKPTASQWKSSEHDLSAYAGKTIVIRVFVTSAWGDMLYLDNIIISSPSDVNDLVDGESLNVNPNPAASTTNFEFNLSASTEINYTVSDVLGKVVEKTNLGNTTGKLNHTLDVSNYKSGLYMVNFQLGERQVVKRLMVVR